MSLPERFGRFQVRGVLGTGATAIVYEGYDASLDRTVAIKMLREELLNADDADEMLERFRREARLIARLRHENLILVYELDEQWNPPFIAMERIEAPNLAEYMKRGHRFSVEETVEIVTQLLSALTYIHDERLVHRDIKPSNVFWTHAQPLKLADFGVAQIRSSTLTRAGTEVGTPAYMSPEQFLGERVDARSDLWSCGVILYELLSGQRLFKGGYDTVREAVLGTGSQPDLLSEQANLPSELAEVVQHALTRNLADRFQTAAQFKQALEKAYDEGIEERTVVRPPGGQRVVGVPGGEGASMVRTAKRSLQTTARLWLGKRKLLAAAALVILLGAAAVVFKLQSARLDAAKVQRIVSAFGCADLQHDIDGNLVSVSGFVQSAEDALKLEAQLKGVSGVRQVVAQLQVRGWPYCELLPMLAPYAKSRVADAGGMRLRVLGYAGKLQEGEAIVLDMVTPAFPAYVYVDYFQLDGNVVHLFPGANAAGRELPPSTSKVVPDPREPLRLEVRSPFGQEMLVMIASRQPLSAGPQTEFEPAREYLPTLERALAAQGKGGVAADYLFILTAAKDAK